MIPARRPAPRSTLPVSALIAIAIVPGLFLLLAWSSVANLIEHSSRQESEHNAGAARRWSFNQTDALVLPGSVGLEHASFASKGMSLTLSEGEADLSLRTQPRPIALEALSSATLALDTEGPVSAWLIAQVGDGIEHAGARSFATAAVDGLIRLQIPPAPPDQPASSLRLHLSASPGTTLQLSSIELLPRASARPDVCAAQESVASTLQHCGIGQGVIRLPALLVPERLLAFADGLGARSIASMQVRGSLAAAQHALELTATRSFTLAATGLALLVGVLLIGLRVARDSMVLHRVSLRGLGLVVMPVALLWLGIPRHAPDSGAMPLAASLAILLLLPRQNTSWKWLGDRAAWIATMRLGLVALLVIAALALCNALDEDAFAVRTADLDKLWIYPLWAAFQQYLLIAVIGPRTRAGSTSELTAAVCAGAVFGLLHLPNFSLMLFTFAAGSAWAWQGYRHRSLLPLIVSHALLGALLMLFAPTWLMRSAEIGGRFLMPP